MGRGEFGVITAAPTNHRQVVLTETNLHRWESMHNGKKFNNRGRGKANLYIIPA